jgi:N-methylhydantoinase A
MIPDTSMATWVGVDVGGTFTDIAIYNQADEVLCLHKVPSTPDAPERAIGIGMLEAFRKFDLEPRRVARMAHGTTVGTNALIERRTGRVAVVTTAGFRDLLEIGRQTRPKVYDVHCDYPAPLVPRHLRFEVTERIGADGTVYKLLNRDEVDAAARKIVSERVDLVVVCFLNSYAWPEHEQQAARRLRELLPDDIYVGTSSELFPEFREYERFSTAVLNGALVTVMDGYLERFSRRMRESGLLMEPSISHSAGGLMSLGEARRVPIRASLSGPAAGVIGATASVAAAGYVDVITIDVGGTSADVSLLAHGRPVEVHHRSLAGFPLRLTTLDVNAVGAGGGSIAFVDRGGLLKVGPRSAGADPGPACYGKGGKYATLTDANVLLGRLNGEALLDGSMPIRKELAEDAVARLASELGLGILDTALGIVRVACAVMVNAIRSLSVERGHDPGRFALFAFGGAGPLHAVDIARSLGMRRIVIPPHPGVLCAEGLLRSDLRGDLVHTVLAPLRESSVKIFDAVMEALSSQAQEWFRRERVAPDNQVIRRFADLRYCGQNFEISLPLNSPTLSGEDIDALVEDFHIAHDATYGFASRTETVELVNMRVQTWGVVSKPPLAKLAKKPEAAPFSRRDVVFTKGAVPSVPVWRRRDLSAGQRIEGPAIVEQLDATSLIFPGDRAEIDAWGNIVIELAGTY